MPSVYFVFSVVYVSSQPVDAGSVIPNAIMQTTGGGEAIVETRSWARAPHPLSGRRARPSVLLCITRRAPAESRGQRRQKECRPPPATYQQQMERTKKKDTAAAVRQRRAAPGAEPRRARSGGDGRRGLLLRRLRLLPPPVFLDEFDELVAGALHVNRPPHHLLAHVEVDLAGGAADVPGAGEGGPGCRI